MCLNKIKFGIQSIYFTMGSGWGAFQNVSSMKFSSVGNISVVLIINLNQMELEDGKDCPLGGQYSAACIFTSSKCL